MKIKFFFITMILVCAIGYFFYQNQKTNDLNSPSNLTSRNFLRELPAMPLRSLEGEASLTINQLFNSSSKLILIHFWGSWCIPCETEMATFLDFLNKLDLSVIKVLFIAMNDHALNVKKFLKKHEPIPKQITLLIDNNGSYLKYFGPTKVPETFLFNSNQTLIKHFAGPQDWSNPYYFNLFQELSK